MARIDNLTNFLTDVADAIRTKTGSSDTISAEDFDTEIENIPSGGGDDWSDIGYSSTPESIEEIHAYSKQIYDNWDADNPHTFSNNSNIITMPLINTSKMTNMFMLFFGCSNLKEIPAISTISATTINSMCNGCGRLEYVDLSNFDTSNVTNMGNLFQSCRSLTTLNLSSFDTSKVDTIFNLVNGCTNLTTINFGNNFNLSSITDAGNMINMFYNCTKLDDNTLNQILHLCTTVNANFTGAKTLANLGITSSFVNYANIPNLSNYQEFLDAGWTIS